MTNSDLKNKSDFSSEIETVKALYLAINRDDMDAVLALFHPQIERVEPEGFPMSGTYNGIAAMDAHFRTARATWAEGGCTPERILVGHDGKFVACVHVRVRLKDKTDWIDGRLGDGFTFRDGKIVFMKSFVHTNEALAWAGLSANASGSETSR